MKLFCALLVIVLVVLGAHYTVLYLDHQALRQQLAQQYADFDSRLQQERETYQKKINSLQDFIAFGQGNRVAASPAVPATPITTSTDKLGSYVAIQQENLQRTLEKKYSLLMARLGLSGVARAELQALLEQREQILNASSIGYYASQAEIEEAVSRQQQSLAEIDRQIAQLLSSPEDQETYELLKDSAYEQYQMNNFFDQAQGNVLIPNDKREALLISKLEQKQEFTRYLETAGTRIQHASEEEKPFLVEKAYEALNDYKDNFLNSARDNLTPEQFDALRERERKQFEEIWKSLKAGWGVE
jgi:guanylate kinase